MAPTEVLAEQHYHDDRGLCARARRRRAELLTSASPASARVLAAARRTIVVGTHALIQEEVEFASLGVAVVDEQHRFGVEQRARSREGRVAARPGHDRDADPAHGGDDGLRRPRRVGAREPPAGARRS